LIRLGLASAPKFAASSIMKFFPIALAGYLLFGPAQTALARGVVPPDAPWNPAHIELLPPEVQAEIAQAARACNAPIAAQHLFSRYMRDFRTGDEFLALHYEETNCTNSPAICNAEGCLHQIFVSHGGRYRLINSIFAEEMEFRRVNGAVTVDAICASSAPCARDFQWDGSNPRSAKEPAPQR